MNFRFGGLIKWETFFIILVLLNITYPIAHADVLSLVAVSKSMAANNCIKIIDQFDFDIFFVLHVS